MLGREGLVMNHKRAFWLYTECFAPCKLDRLKLEFSCISLRAVRGAKLMKVSRFMKAQKAFVLKQGEAETPVAEVSRKAGISHATSLAWKKKYGGLLPDEMRRLQALEDKAARLKKIVADLTLGPGML